MNGDFGRAPAGRAGRSATRAAKPSRPSGDHPSRKKEWHLVCITRLGRVSMLQNLDLRTARETYKRLKPDEHPVDYKFPDCKKCGEHGWAWSGGWGRSYGANDDWLEKVKIVGPEGVKLDPWHGVKPRLKDMSHLCRCAEKKAKAAKAKPAAPAPINSAAWTGRGE